MKKVLFVCLSLLLASAFAFGLNDTAIHSVILQVNEIALIDLNNTAAITLTTNPPGAGGLDPIGDTDSSKLLQYTSLVASGVTRNITVNWDATDSAPAGTSLSLEAVSVPANCGTAAGALVITDIAQNLITTVGSCATGVGANGAALTYTFDITDVTQLVVGDTRTVTVTFTLADAS
jgi:hypothetical protein